MFTLFYWFWPLRLPTLVYLKSPLLIKRDNLDRLPTNRNSEVISRVLVFDITAVDFALRIILESFRHALIGSVPFKRFLVFRPYVWIAKTAVASVNLTFVSGLRLSCGIQVLQLQGFVFLSWWCRTLSALVSLLALMRTFHNWINSGCRYALSLRAKVLLFNQATLNRLKLGHILLNAKCALGLVGVFIDLAGRLIFREIFALRNYGCRIRSGLFEPSCINYYVWKRKFQVELEDWNALRVCHWNAAIFDPLNPETALCLFHHLLRSNVRRRIFGWHGLRYVYLNLSVFVFSVVLPLEQSHPTISPEIVLLSHLPDL